MKSSLYIRIISIVLVALVALNIIYGYGMTERIRQESEMRMRDEATLILSSLNWSISPLLDSDDESAIQRIVENIGAYPMIREISVVSDNGDVLYSNIFDSDKHLDTSYFKPIFSENKLEYFTRLNKSKELIAVIPVKGTEFFEERGSDVQAALVLVMDNDYEINLMNRLRGDYTLSAVMLTLVLLILISFVLFRELAVPLNHFKGVVEAVSRRDYSMKVTVRQKGELQQLANAFNHMTNAVTEHTDELIKETERAELAANAKVEFLANMSHEIRTPLNSIIGFTDLLEEVETDNEKLEKLHTIQNSGHHLLTIINDILDISKTELNGIQLNASPFYMRTLVAEIKEAFEVGIKQSDVIFKIFISESVPSKMLADAHRLRQIIANLVSNALKFTAEGHIYVRIDYNMPYLTIEVEDTGIGIHTEAIHKIFDPFVQSDMSQTRLYGGTGLGLAICRRIAKAMEGDIEVKSQVGVGSTFTVYIKVEVVETSALSKNDYNDMVLRWMEHAPEVSDLVVSVIQSLPERYSNMMKAVANNNSQELADLVHSLKGTSSNFHMDEIYHITLSIDKQMKETMKIDKSILAKLKALKKVMDGIPNEYYEMIIYEAPLDQEYSGPLKVLLAEDVYENRELIRQILLGQPVTIEFAENGMEALDKIYENAYDVLLLDIQMPVMGGDDVLKKLRADTAYNDLYIIVLTAHARKEDMEKYISAGADSYMSKPINKEMIRAKMIELLEQRGAKNDLNS